MAEERMKQKNTPPQLPNRRPGWKALIVALILSWLLAPVVFRGFGPSGPLQVSYTGFKDKVRGGRIAEVTVRGQEITGRFKTPVQGEKGSGLFSGEAPHYETFKTILPSFGDPALMGLLEKNDVVIHAETEERSWLWTLVVGLLPWLLIIGFFMYSSKKFQERMGGMGGPFGFAKSKAKLYTKTTSEVSFRDVAGLANTKKELAEVVAYLKEPSRFQSLGGKLPKGILLVGPPGVGKTLMARAVAGEAEVPFFSISGSEFIEMFVGVGASRVRDMFAKAKKDAPSIIFVDELDSIGRVRGTGLGGGHDEREQTLNQILAEMDGFAPQESVIVIAATNRPDVLDPALVRPGRFDRRITLELPQKRARREILEIHTRDMPLADDVDLGSLAAKTVGFSGAELRNLANEAALLAAREDRKKVRNEDFDDARDKILMGIEREDRIQEEEKKVVACHEAGHAIVALHLPGADPLEKVSIIPRGHSLGATEQIPEEDRHNLSRNYLLNRIAIMLGGRAAEKLRFEDVTSGAGDDLKKATELARRMVCQWGMSDRVGPVAFRQGEPHPFLGREMAAPKDYSETTARLIDEEIRRIVQQMEGKARDVLEHRRGELDALVAGLLEHETLSREEISAIFSRDSIAQNPDEKQRALGSRG